jgi:hypothetical protein
MTIHERAALWTGSTLAVHQSVARSGGRVAMSRHRGTIAAATLVLVLSSVPGVAVAEEVDGVCDLEISLNRAPTLLDNVVVEAYAGQEIFPVGRGFPPGGDPSTRSGTVQFDFYVNGLPRFPFWEPIADDGSVNAQRSRAFRFEMPFWNDAAGVTGEVRATYLGVGEPCTDSVMVTSLGPLPVFADAATSRFIPEILALAEAGVITGCTPTQFCPQTSITRAQTAAFIARALDLPAATEDFFDDDDGNPLEGAINSAAAAGIVTGCGDRAFCPTERITRAEMAAFLVRGFELPPSDIDRFADDNGLTLEDSINALAAAGVTKGCRSGDPTRFCPTLFVKRDEMAGFLYRALNPS